MEQKCKCIGWKVTAIIFIVLFTLSAGVIIWAYDVGTQAIEDEMMCSNDICYYYDAYLFDSSSNMCYCYQDNEVALTKYIKS